MKPTIGPWFAVQPEHTNGWWVVSHDEEGFDTIDASADGGFEEDIAKLVAVTPELLELAQATVDGLTADSRLHSALLTGLAHRAKAIIAKTKVE